MTNEQTIDEIMAAVITSQVATAAYDGSSGQGIEELEREMFAADDEVRTLITAALAAKDAEIERLTRECSDLRASLAASEASDAESIRMYRSARDERDELRKRLSDAEPASPEPGEWIEWAGGECPLNDSVRHSIRKRDGWQSAPDIAAADWYGWRHNGSSADIVAYRVLA